MYITLQRNLRTDFIAYSVEGPLNTECTLHYPLKKCGELHRTVIYVTVDLENYPSHNLEKNTQNSNMSVQLEYNSDRKSLQKSSKLTAT